MNITNYIENINDINIQIKSNVCSTIIDIIDKNELIKEYQDDNVFDNIILESMMIFMESKNRERDKTPRNEISKWMAEQGFWYTGDNPNKKKKSMRMYHFLQQHKFDPKDNTYESDIKNSDGSKRRIRLNIIGPQSEKISKDKKEYDRYMEILKSGKAYINDAVTPMEENEKSTYNYLQSLIKDINAVKEGRNAYFDPKSEDITIGAKELQGKQIHSQHSLKHEEGHSDSYTNKHDNSFGFIYGYKGYTGKDAPEAAEAIIKHRASGKYANDHDSDPEELMADLYSAMNISIRTKDWGKNKTTRKITKRELISVYNKMTEHVNVEKAIEDEIKRQETRVKNLSDIIYPALKERVHELLESKFKETKEERKSILSIYDPTEFSKELLYAVSTTINRFLDNYDEFDVDVLNKFKNSYNFERNNKWLQKIKTAQKIYKDILDAYKKHSIYNMRALENYMLKQNIDNDENYSCIVKLFENACNTYDLLDNYTKIMEKLNKRKEQAIEQIKEEMKEFKENYSGKYLLRIKKIILEGVEFFDKHNMLPRNFENKVTDNLKPIIDDIANKIKDNPFTNRNDEMLEKYKKRVKESHELRNNFIQSMIKEYFDELFSDDIYLD